MKLFGALVLLSLMGCSSPVMVAEMSSPRGMTLEGNPPSVVNNFVTFRATSGSRGDAGFTAIAVALADDVEEAPLDGKLASITYRDDVSGLRCQTWNGHVRRDGWVFTVDAQCAEDAEGFRLSGVIREVSVVKTSGGW